MIFTVEEISLISSFDHSGRMAAAADIMKSLPTVQDENLKQLCKQTVKKLQTAGDTKFSVVKEILTTDLTTDFLITEDTDE